MNPEGYRKNRENVVSRCVGDGVLLKLDDDLKAVGRCSPPRANTNCHKVALWNGDALRNAPHHGISRGIEGLQGSTGSVVVRGPYAQSGRRYRGRASIDAQPDRLGNHIPRECRDHREIGSQRGSGQQIAIEWIDSRRRRGQVRPGS